MYYHNKDDIHMERMHEYFQNKRKLIPEIDDVCLKILQSRLTPYDGITINEIKEEYAAFTDATFPIVRCITEFMLTIPHVACYSNAKGTRFFYYVK